MTINPESFALHGHTCEDHGMKFGHYYVVEVSFNKNNPVFMAIAGSARSGGSIQLWNGGFESLGDGDVRLSRLSYFRVVEEIVAMRNRPSRHMPPSLTG